MNRRNFLKLCGAGLGSVAAAPLLSAASGAAVKAGVISEAARDIPIAGEADVIVCGAGPAGVAAAIAAARRELHQLVNGLRSLGGPWQGYVFR